MRGFRLLFLASALLAGCIKPAPVVQAEQRVDVAVASVLASVDGDPLQAAPDAVREEISAVLAERNLGPVIVEPSVYVEPFEAVRTTPSRLALLAEQAAAPALVLVESTARFSSQMNGRYRWTVDVTVSLVPRDAVDDGLSAAFVVPVALVYSHQGEAEALAEAAPVVARQVGGLLDEWIATRNAAR